MTNKKSSDLPKMNFSEAYTIFRKIEDEHDLFSKKIQGVPFWDYMRVSVWYTLLQKLNIYGKPHHVDENGDNKLRSRAHLLKNILLRNPFFANRNDYLFLLGGARRRKLEGDGKYWDLHCDPVIDYLASSDCLTLEAPASGNSHCANSKTAKLTSTSVFKLIQKLPIHQKQAIELNTQERRFCERIEREFCRNFNIDFVGINEIFARKLKARFYLRLAFSAVLRRVKPKAVFLVCSYGKETYIEVSKEFGIPVIELQHGTISSFHLGYSYPSGTHKSLFPDYFFSFGKFWEDSVDLPIPSSHIHTIGYPYLEKNKDAYSKIRKEKLILFISQGTIGKELASFAVDLQELLPCDWGITYKLHPGEVSGWQERYPKLRESTVEVVTSDEPPLYELMARASIQIGVYSTALYEGLAFGCKTYIVGLPGKEYMEALLSKGMASLVTEPEDISCKQSLVRGNELNYFFSENCRNNFMAAVEAVVGVS